MNIELKIGRATFNEVKFCVSALDRKSDKEYRTVIKIDKGVMTGTDGYRLHQWLECNYLDGYYKVFKNTKIMMILTEITGHEVDYPDLKPVFQEDKKHSLMFSNFIFETVGKENLRVSRHAIITRDMLDVDRALYFNYLDALDGVFDVYYYERNSPIIFVNKEKAIRAAIMPVVF